MRNWILLFLGWAISLSVSAQSPSISFIVNSQTYSETADTVWIAVSILNHDANPTSVAINIVGLGGNAVNGVNFAYTPVTITFPGGSAFTQQFPVVILDDSVVDGDKSVTFGFDTLSATNGVTIGSPATYTLVMTDADTPKLSFSIATYTVPEDTTPIHVRVSLNRGVRDTTKVNVKLVHTGTTAVKGVDFNFNTTTLVWPPDSAAGIDVVIPLINNPFYERQRTVEIGLDSSSNNAVAMADSTFTLRIKANSGYSVASCSDLFFSQYVEGYNLDRAVQIYNPTSVPIDMSVYSVLVSYNAGTSFTQYNLNGILQPNGVYVVANSAARGGLLALANATSYLINFDGTDAVALLHNTDTIDVIGQFNVNPGPTGWPVGTGSTHQHTLIRNYYTYAGDTNWARASLTWDVYRAELIDSLPFHYTDTCGGLKPVATVRFLNPYDSIPQILQSFDSNIVVQVNNPTGDTLQFYIAADPSLSTAQEGYAYDYVFSNQQTISPPGITYDTLRPLFIFPRPEITPTKTIVFRFIDMPGNMKAIPDSVFTLYLTNNNKFVVSFFGAGYSYPKGSGSVKIPLVASTYSSQPTTVDVTLSTGSAIAGQDFLFNDTTVTFPAFSLDTQGVWVNILNNDVYQTNKQVNFDLSNLTNGAVLGINAFTLTIINNDSLAGGVSDNKVDLDFKLFPNPVTDQLIVRSETNLPNVQITDIVGHLISSLGTLARGTNSINVSHLPSGTYFLSSAKSNEMPRQRFVKVE